MLGFFGVGFAGCPPSAGVYPSFPFCLLPAVTSRRALAKIPGLSPPKPAYYLLIIAPAVMSRSDLRFVRVGLL